MSCDPKNYKDLDWCDGQSVLPGIMPKVYAIAKKNIVAWPTLPSDYVTALGELATYSGSFTLAATAVWAEVGVTIEKSPVKSDSQGVYPAKSFMNTGTFMHPGVGADASGFARQANNDDLVYLFQDKSGNYRLLGNEIFKTETTISQNLGGAVGDEVGTTLNVAVSDVAPAPFYTGEIVTASGTINPQV